MKIKYSTLILGLLLMISCKVNSETKPTEVEKNSNISGHVSGYDAKIGLYGPAGNFEIELDENGNFSQEIDKDNVGTYTLAFGMENRFSVYIKQNTNLNLEIDYNKLLNREDSAIIASGENIAETQLLMELFESSPKNQYSRVAFKDEYLPMVNTKNPEDFERYQLEEIKKTNKKIETFKTNNPDLDSEFLEILTLETLLDNNKKFSLYENYHTYFAPDVKVDIPEKFEDYFAKEIPQNDFDLYKKSSSYASYVSEKYYAILAENLKDYQRETLDYYKAQVKFLESSDFPKIIKDRMHQSMTIGYMRTKDPELKAWLDKTIAEKVTDENALKRYKEFKAKEVGYVDGDMAPDFTLKNIQGKDVSLSDFKGSVVYIDLWATWCGPCIKGLPYFKKLKKKYKNDNIKFVMLSFDEDMEAWNKMVKENRDGLFEGIQLATGSYQNDIGSTYNVNGIPHYILIDKEGKIVQKNAMDPYNPKLIKVLDNLIK